MSNPQPTLDDTWVVFETLVNVANANGSQVVDILQFLDNVEKGAIQSLNYEAWHSRWKRAAKAMAEDIMPIFDEKNQILKIYFLIGMFLRFFVLESI